MESHATLTPAGTLERFVRWLIPWRQHQGLGVFAISAPAPIADAAILRVHAALDVLLAVAPAQHARLPQCMHGILVRRLEGLRGAWPTTLRICYLDLGFVMAPATTPAMIASVLVHELMHARLYRAQIPYTAATRARVERVCALASRNFERLLPDPVERAHLQEITRRYLELDPSYWSDEAMYARDRAWRAAKSWRGRMWQDATAAIGRWVRPRAI